jgi:hypothetical protein
MDDISNFTEALVAMSCQHGYVRRWASMAAAYWNPHIVIWKPDIAYRGVLGSSFQDYIESSISGLWCTHSHETTMPLPLAVMAGPDPPSPMLLGLSPIIASRHRAKRPCHARVASTVAGICGCGILESAHLNIKTRCISGYGRVVLWLRRNAPH